MTYTFLSNIRNLIFQKFICKRKNVLYKLQYTWGQVYSIQIVYKSFKKNSIQITFVSCTCLFSSLDQQFLLLNLFNKKEINIGLTICVKTIKWWKTNLYMSKTTLFVHIKQILYIYECISL